MLEEGDTEVPAISDLLGQATEAIINLSKIDSAQEKLSEQVVALAEGLSDVTTSLQDYREKIEFNPRRLEEVEIRLDLINTLKRKYGNSIDTHSGLSGKSPFRPGKHHPRRRTYKTTGV